MKSIPSSSIAGILIILLCGSAIGSAKPLRRASRPSFEGTWQLNTRLSTNGRSELPGRLDSDVELLPIAATDGWTQAEADPKTTELLEATELLEVFLHGRQLTMNATGSADIVFTRTVFTDGRTVTVETSRGRKRIVRGQLNDSELSIETNDGQTTISESYNIDRNNDRLFATIVIKNPAWRQPLIVDRVYDRISGRQ